MNQLSSAPPRHEVTTSLAMALTEAHIAMPLAEGCFQLGDGRCARQAASCLLQPAAGDNVLLLEGQSGLFVLAVLLRKVTAEPSAACLAVPGATALRISQARLELHAEQTIALRCHGEVELTSARAAISLQGQHLLASVGESVVLTARHLVAQTEHCSVQASALLRLHGGQAMLTARGDMKLDAERVSLG
jgi:hypothetical protein